MSHLRTGAAKPSTPGNPTSAIAAMSGHQLPMSARCMHAAAGPYSQIETEAGDGRCVSPLLRLVRPRWTSSWRPSASRWVALVDLLRMRRPARRCRCRFPRPQTDLGTTHCSFGNDTPRTGDYFLAPCGDLPRWLHLDRQPASALRKLAPSA